ncbi:MAG TPA: L-alanine-DL-glutamate epimerase, partial [Spirochaetales bacterium]|nr:L-alanine-DL-glutamate epimerase [Spirochaetales bacterium]
MAERGAQLARGQTFRNPIEAIQSILTELHTFGCRITGRKDLSRTFTLNTLVSLDLAFWKLYADEMGNERFSDILPDPLQHILSFQQTALVHVPLITYNVDMEELLILVHRGHFLLKIKLGQQGDQAEMLQQDMERLTQIHRVLRNEQIHNPNGDKILYYLDANSRYQKRETLLRLV